MSYSGKKGPVCVCPSCSSIGIRWIASKDISMCLNCGWTNTESIIQTDKTILYLCDRRQCDKCSSECKHTTDINHAKFFIKGGSPDVYIQEEVTHYSSGGGMKDICLDEQKEIVHHYADDYLLERDPFVAKIHERINEEED